MKSVRKFSTNEQADVLGSKAFEVEAQRAVVNKKYFDKTNVDLSALDSTRKNALTCKSQLRCR